MPGRRSAGRDRPSPIARAAAPAGNGAGVEPETHLRRRLRVQFIAVVGAYMVAIVIAELVLRGARPAEWLSAANAAGILAVTLYLVARMVQLRGADLFGPPAPSTPLGSSPAVADPRDRHLLERLGRVVADDRAYLQQGLRIGGRSDRLGIQQYRLRRLINRNLG